MTRQVQEPTLRREDDMGKSYEHPAWATISAHRVQGHADLFGSHVGQSGFVQIEINNATLMQTGYSEHIHGTGRSLVRLWMSEAQWVAFVSRMNMGSGVPCTLKHVPSGSVVTVPDLPPQEKASEKLDSHAREIHAKNMDRVTKGMEQVRGLMTGLPVKKAAAIMQAVEHMAQHLKVNHDFALTQLTEHKEKLVTEAKVEIDAMVSGIVTQLGVDSLQQLVQLAAHPLQPINPPAGGTDDADQP